MPIVVNYGPSPMVLGLGAYRAGRGAYDRWRQELLERRGLAQQGEFNQNLRYFTGLGVQQQEAERQRAFQGGMAERQYGQELQRDMLRYGYGERAQQAEQAHQWDMARFSADDRWAVMELQLRHQAEREQWQAAVDQQTRGEEFGQRRALAEDQFGYSALLQKQQEEARQFLAELQQRHQAGLAERGFQEEEKRDWRQARFQETRDWRQADIESQRLGEAAGYQTERDRRLAEYERERMGEAAGYGEASDYRRAQIAQEAADRAAEVQAVRDVFHAGAAQGQARLESGLGMERFRAQADLQRELRAAQEAGDLKQRMLMVAEANVKAGTHEYTQQQEQEYQALQDRAEKVWNDRRFDQRQKAEALQQIDDQMYRIRSNPKRKLKPDVPVEQQGAERTWIDRETGQKMVMDRYGVPQVVRGWQNIEAQQAIEAKKIAAQAAIVKRKTSENGPEETVFDEALYDRVLAKALQTNQMLKNPEGRQQWIQEQQTGAPAEKFIATETERRLDAEVKSFEKRSQEHPRQWGIPAWGLGFGTAPSITRTPTKDEVEAFKEDRRPQIEQQVRQELKVGATRPGSAQGPASAPVQAPAMTPQGVPVVRSDADYDKLPSGTVFVGPDGKRRRKP